MSKNFLVLFDYRQLFVYAIAPFVLIFQRGTQGQASRRLTIAGVIFIAVPFTMLNLRDWDPNPRYYLFAVPLLSLAAFLAVGEAARFSKVLLWILSMIVLSAWSAWNVKHGFPVNLLKTESIISRAQYLDFDSVQEALAANFSGSAPAWRIAEQSIWPLPSESFNPKAQIRFGPSQPVLISRA